MKIYVKAKPKAKKEGVVPPVPALLPGGDDVYTVSVKEVPVDGKANEAIIRVLAEYFKVPKSSVRIVSGQTAKRKTVEII